MTRPRWTDKYNCHNTRVGPVAISISWPHRRDEKGWKVSVAGRRLKNESTNLAEVKKRALRVAVKLMQDGIIEAGEALQELQEAE